MKTVEKCVLFGSLLGFFTATTHAATYTAASCNQSDVNAIINGPTHSAVNGDTIVIPAGACTWTSGLSISVGITVIGTGTPNTTPSTFGAGTLSTVIVDNAGSSNSLFAFSGITYGNTVRISTLDIEPQSSSTGLTSPISVAGSCNSSGCPNLRVDNIGFGITTPWTESGNSSNADTMIRTDGVFGVIDHNTLPTGSAVVFANISHSAYLGVGAYGDNSWAQPDSFGGANSLYLENNNLTIGGVSVTDSEFAPAGGAVGGGRQVGRFNQITANGAFFLFGVHGLDTDGRPQGGRQVEAYGNVERCINGSCGSGAAAFRSGTGFVFGNTLNADYPVTGGFYNTIADITVYRIVLGEAPWGSCGGNGPYDTNDRVTYYSGTMSAAGGSLTMTDSSKTWTTNQFTPNGAPYSVYDVTQGFYAEIASNTSDTVTIVSPISESGWTGFNNGDSYQILRATVCADQGGRGAGGYTSGSAATPSGALNQALDPIYEWDDTASNLNHGNMGTDTGRTIANRDWYTDNSNGSPHAQTSPTSPFNGTSGVGFGPLANRPNTCTPHVGYWATDQGSWNQSGNGFGQGQLFVCTATNTWTTYYTPYTYPHPLTQSGTCTISPGSIGPYTAGQSVSQTFMEAGCNSSTFTISSGSLTGSGLGLNSATGVLSGTAVAGSFSFTVAYGTSGSPISLVINGALAAPTSLQVTVH
jgi:hypothetical protein